MSGWIDRIRKALIGMVHLSNRAKRGELCIAVYESYQFQEVWN